MKKPRQQSKLITDAKDMNACRYIIIVFFCACYLVNGQQRLTGEENIIAQTLLGEARGEGKAGLYAIACIVKRRIELESYPNTATKVCLQSSQFDYWTQHKRVKWDDINRANVRRLLKTDTELVRYAKMLAININRVDLSYTKNADHYCTLDTHNYWTKGREPVATIGNHKFYKLK